MKFFRCATLIAFTAVTSFFGAVGSHAGPVVAARPAAFKKVFSTHRAGEILVKFKAPYRDARSEQGVLDRAGARKLQTIESGLAKVAAPEGRALMDAIAEMAAQPEVEWAQPNYIYRKLALPNDPQFTQLWGFKNTAQTVTSGNYAQNNPGVAGRDMGLEAAWNTTTNCIAAPVAIVDTGVNYNHADLAANMWDGGATYPNHGYDYVDNDNNPMDLDGHGTHVAGIIGAVGNNGVGTSGVCWQARLMAVRVLDASGSGTTADVVSGINFAVNNGAKVINLSLGQSANDPAMESAIINARNQGVIVVAAAGNEGANNDAGGSPTYPCNYHQPNLICVAALDQAFSLASFSNYGAQSVMLGAPGTNVRSEWAGTNAAISDDFNNGGTLDWTRSNNTWAYVSRTLGDGMTYPMLVNPANWNGTSAQYANNANARAYKTFNLAGTAAAIVEFDAFVDTEAGFDFFRTAYRASTGDPFGGGGSLVGQESGSGGSSSVYLAYDVTGCISAQCTVGFQFTSDASQTSFGVGILNFSITTLTLNNTSYRTIDGTSMATPMVAGLVALVWAYNPQYTYTDVVEAIQAGGTPAAALAGKSITGKAAYAAGALSHIFPPTGVTVDVR
ncbi:MAG: S8 family serine peptidase [Bacteriovoracia bacterium]